MFSNSPCSRSTFFLDQNAYSTTLRLAVLDNGKSGGLRACAGMDSVVLTGTVPLSRTPRHGLRRSTPPWVPLSDTASIGTWPALS
ncbi:hypothetical protein DTO164E3_4309 [Paecilomyces variotii]|nr:hypothetical protein DTO164E3_4309 [Paecilomyces variotii]